jgi:hypothetical protein
VRYRRPRIVQTVQCVDGKLQELRTKTGRSNRTVHLPARCRYTLAVYHRELQKANGCPRRLDGELSG